MSYLFWPRYLKTVISMYLFPVFCFIMHNNQVTATSAWKRFTKELITYTRFIAISEHFPKENFGPIFCIISNNARYNVV